MSKSSTPVISNIRRCWVCDQANGGNIVRNLSGKERKKIFYHKGHKGFHKAHKGSNFHCDPCVLFTSLCIADKRNIMSAVISSRLSKILKVVFLVSLIVLLILSLIVSKRRRKVKGSLFAGF